MVLLAHLSDPHLGPLPPIRPGDLISKRLIGYLNWRHNRSRLYDDAIVETLTTDISTAACDHIVVTGDLVNLALPAEFDRAREWLDTLGGPDRVTVVPGNHDAYVPGAVDALYKAWRPFMTGDTPAGVPFPFIRRRGPLALIGVSTAVASLPLMATGTAGELQIDALARALAETRREGLFRVVLIHHSPVARATAWTRRLTDASRIRDAIARQGAELVLHGHNHHASVHLLPGPDAPVPVVGAAGASMRPHDRHPGGSYNLVRIERTPSSWRATMRERRITMASTVVTAQERSLVG